MGNYFPVANPVANFTLQASGSGTGGDPVEFSGDGQVQRATGDGRYAGIAAQDFTAGHSLTVYVGHAEFSGPAEGAVTAGDDLAASGVRQVRTAQPGDDVIGRAYSAAVDGGTVKWVQR